ncbi:hypothetical protein FB45DRAFT_679842, partial [Roridomyces roridus]
RSNCGCVGCKYDRNILGCENPGKCIQAATLLVNSLLPKWDPRVPNNDFCDELKLDEEEMVANDLPIGIDRPVSFDPNFVLRSIESGFRIF